MNKKALGPVGALVLFGIFLLIWFLWLGGFVNQMGTSAMQLDNATGLEAFLLSNLNLAVFICMLLGISAWMYFTNG